MVFHLLRRELLKNVIQRLLYKERICQFAKNTKYSWISIYIPTTKAYNLPCDYVIHTVGPIWNGGRNREEELLANCYFNSMKLAMDNGIRSIAFPSISTGVYSFPVELAAKIAVHTVNRFLQDNPDSFDLVEWVLFDTHTESVYEAEVDQLYKMI